MTALDLVRPALPANGVEWTLTSASVVDPDLDVEQLERLVAAAAAGGDAARWWIGDLLLFGEQRHGESYAQILDAARVSERQASRYRWVAERVVRSRRRENLPFSHHEEVAPLEPADQARLLDRAARERLSVSALRELVRDLRALEPRPPSGRRQVVGAGELDTVRELGAARETLTTVGSALDADGAEAIGLPRALRAVDDASRRAAASLARPALVELARRVAREATRSSGFAMVPVVLFEEFVAAVAAEE